MVKLSMPPIRKTILCYFITLISLLRFTESSFTVTVEPGEDECFFIKTPANRDSVITGSFECMEDDVCDDTFSVDVSELLSNQKLFSPEGGTREGVFKLEKKISPGARYALCFHNDDSSVEKPISVGFSVRLTNAPRTLPDDEIGPDSKRALQLVNKATAIHQDWQALLDHFDFLRNREAVQTQLSDGTLSRLQRWTWIESILVAGMATAQVWYWKRFFETRRYL